MRGSFTTISDLRDELADTMQLDGDAVTRAIRAHRDLFDRYETISAREYSAIAHAVWEDVTGEPYPADWQQADDRLIEEEEHDAEMLRESRESAYLGEYDYNASDLVLCESPDGWSLHAPGSTDEEIASGDAPYLVDGAAEPTPADYARALEVLRERAARAAREG